MSGQLRFAWLCVIKQRSTFVWSRDACHALLKKCSCWVLLFEFNNIYRKLVNVLDELILDLHNAQLFMPL